jgi:AcrR family transcriptional regulator
MDETVKPRRAYHAPVRRARAAAVRERIVEAATQSFLERGFAGVTVDEIAMRAGTSAQTVYTAFGTKAGLLISVVAARVANDAQGGIALFERAWMRPAVEEPDPIRRLAAYSAGVRQIYERAIGLFEVLREAGTHDPTVAALWTRAKLARLDDQVMVAEALERAGALREGLAVKRAADVLWTLVGPEVYAALVEERGWSPAEYQGWLAAMLAAALLVDHARPAEGT